MKNMLFDYLERFMVLTPDEKEAIIDLDIFRTFKKGHILLREGERSTESYFVVKGCIRCYYIIDGEEKTTEFFTELEPYTPPSALSNTPSEHFISCVEDCVLTVGRLDKGAEIFEKFPRFEKMCRTLSEHLLAQKQVHFDDFRTSSAELRYLNLIKSRPDLIQRVPQYQLASYLGITPQSLSRMRARLAKQPAIY